MSDQDDIFRISIRFNKHEYSDVDQYLSRFTGANKGAHIRMLIRLAACRTFSLCEIMTYA